MNISVTARLATMMFLQFFLWGSWYVTAPNYLSRIGFKASDFGWTYSVGPIAGLVTPLLVGMIADRFFAAQRVMAVLHLLGGAVMIGAITLMQKGDSPPSLINAVLLGYMLTYFPTLALSNTIAMKAMTNPEKEFPPIRVFGTLGWIAAGLAVTWMKLETNVGMFYVAAGAAFLLGLFSFSLPQTPPSREGTPSAAQLLGLDALRLLKDRAFLVFMVSSVLICIPLAFYYQIASRVVEMADLPIGQTMSFGQVSEIFFMLVMPIFFAWLGVKWMLVAGMFAWVVRYTLFAVGAPIENVPMIVLGVLLHGICYDFFFVTGQIYTDRKAPSAIRAQAQGLLVMLTLGVGMLIGAQTAAIVEARFTPASSHELGAQVQEKTKQLETLKAGGQAAATGAQTNVADLEQEIKSLRLEQLRQIQWGPLWGAPAAFAAVVMIFFALLFRDAPQSTAIPKDSDLMS